MTTIKESKFFEKINREKVLNELIKIFGKNNVSNKPHDLFPYSYDMTESTPHMPDFVVIPENVDQIVLIVKFCSEYHIPIVPYVSGNNVGGLTIPEEGGIMLDVGKKMNKVVHVHESMMYAILEPGVTFGQLSKYLEKHHPQLKYAYAFAPPYASVVANVLLSGLTNLSCTYGGMADWINGLEVVLSNGEVVRTGSCFLSKEFKEDNWFVRYPIPDLSGLFICWQGMTGIVTKCAVQLWPKKEYNGRFLGVIYGHDTLGEVLRELGRTECCEDVSAINSELLKYTWGKIRPEKFEKEPDYAALISISGQTKELYQAKLKHVKAVYSKIQEKFNQEALFIDFDSFSKLAGDEILMYVDLPSVLTPLFEWDGLTWVGSYANPDNLGPLLKKCYDLFQKYEMEPILFTKSMKASHYCIFRPITRYKKETEEEKVAELQHELLEVMLDYDCVPYKTPLWMTDIIKKRCDQNWVELLKKIKHTMDPNRIFNPGRWGL